MALIVQYDPSSTPVANQVTLIDPSGDTSQYSGQSNTLINPASGVPGGVAMKFLKVVGSDVVEMSQAEKDSIAAEEAAALIVSVRGGAKSSLDQFESYGLLLRALADIIKDEINILRAEHGLADRTLAQLRTAIKNRIDSGSVDA